MLTLKQLRDDKELAIARLKKKGVDAAPIIAKIEELDDKRKAIQAELDSCLAEQNKAAKQIGALMGQGKRDEAEAMKQQVAALKSRSAELSAEHQKAQEELQAQIVLLPNFPAEIVPEGRTAEDNVVVFLGQTSDTRNFSVNIIRMCGSVAGNTSSCLCPTGCVRRMGMYYTTNLRKCLVKL